MCFNSCVELQASYMCTLVTNNIYCVKLFFRKPRYTHFCSVWNIILSSLYQKCRIWAIKTIEISKKNIFEEEGALIINSRNHLHWKVTREQAVKLKQEKPLKFHVIARESLAANMESYWEQANGHAQPPHPVKFERWEKSLQFFFAATLEFFLVISFYFNSSRSCFWPQFSAFTAAHTIIYLFR